MSDNFATAIVVCCTGFFALFALLVFAASNSKSNFESFLDAWKEKRLAELELKKIQAQHERVCPRLTDAPRK